MSGVVQAKLKAAEGRSWAEIAGEIIDTLDRADQPMLFMWDELPAMLRTFADHTGTNSAREYMAWFRSLRLNGDDSLRRNRFIIAGSTGLNYLLDQRLADPGLISDFRRVTIGPLSAPTAKDLCRQLAKATGFVSDDIGIDYLLQRIGQSVPYFIQLFFAQAEQAYPPGDRSLNRTTIDAVFKTQIVGVPCKAYFDQYRRRLKRYPPAIEAAVVEILATIAVSDTAVSSDELYSLYAANLGADATHIAFAELLADLECDWYLQCDPDTGRYTFYMAVMRDWWARWYRAAIHNSRKG